MKKEQKGCAATPSTKSGGIFYFEDDHRDRAARYTVKYGVAFKRGGTKYISELIQKGIDDGTRTATITGNWDIESHIRIPSDFTLIFDGCYLKMADTTFDNMFVNEHHNTEIGRTISGTDKNIRLIGKNEAIIDGGTYNGLSEYNQNKEGRPSIRLNVLISFTNVDGFEVTGLKIHNFRWWAFCSLYCQNGHIHDIDFKADDTCIDKDGNVYHGLSLDLYFDMHVKQADGIDIRRGCHDIVIEDIRGFAGDDLVALTCLDGGDLKNYSVEGMPDDLCNITVRNINGCALDACVRILCQGNSTLHDVLIDGVCDMSDKISGINGRGLQAIRLGDSHILYGSDLGEGDKCYNITVKNVRSRAVYAMYFGGKPIKNLVYENIETFDDGGYIDNHWETN